MMDEDGIGSIGSVGDASPSSAWAVSSPGSSTSVAESEPDSSPGMRPDVADLSVESRDPASGDGTNVADGIRDWASDPGKPKADGNPDEENPTAEGMELDKTDQPAEAPKLNEDHLLRRGTRGEDVRRMQEALNRNGANLKVDGILGAKTETAIRQYQRQHHLRTDGVAGPKTLGALNGNQGSGRPAGSSGPQTWTPSGGLAADAQGRVDPEQLRAYLERQITNSRLNGHVPADAARYGVNGSPRSWANYLTKLAGVESSYNTNDVSEPHAFRGGSRGLFQLSFDDAPNYGLNGGRPFSAEQLADPAFNADAALAIQERLILNAGSIRGGAGRYWGPIRRGWTGA